MAISFHSAMEVYENLVLTVDTSTRSLVLKYLEIDLPDSKIVDESLGYLHTRDINVSIRPDEWVAAISIPSARASSPLPALIDSDPLPENSANISKTIPIRTPIPLLTIDQLIAKSSSDPKARRRGTGSTSSAHQPTISSADTSKQKGLKRKHSDIVLTGAELFAKVVDALVSMEESSPAYVTPNPTPLIDISSLSTLSKPRLVMMTSPSAVSNSKKTLNLFACKTCGEMTSDRVCIWNRVGVIPGPCTASALKYLNAKKENFSSDALFPQNSHAIASRAVRQEDIHRPSLVNMAKLESNLTSVMAKKIQYLNQLKE